MASQPIIISDSYHLPIEQFSMPTHYRDSIDSVMVPSGMIKDRIQQMASEIHQDYEGKNPTLVCVLKGAFRFFSDLTYELERMNGRIPPQKLAKRSVPFSIDFLRAKSYGNQSSTGDVQLFLTQLDDIKGRDVLLVEDIVDTGETAVHLIEALKKYNPASVKMASVLVKRTSKSNGYVPDYAGFSIPDKFVVGYCLDYNEWFRDLQHLCVLNDHGQEKYKKKES